jgi:hypothetical protein
VVVTGAVDTGVRVIERERTRPPLLTPVVPAVVAGGLAVMAILLRWRGSDLPAHFFRVGLVERGGYDVWNNYWYGGHHTPGYGVLFPVLGAAVGIWTIAVASAAVSAMLVDVVIRAAIGHRNWWASMWFAVSTVTNVAVGRLPFALGMTLGLAAVWTAQRRWRAAMLAFALLTPAASPVVSVFLVLIFAAWAIVATTSDRRWFLAAAAVTVAPVLVVAVVYPQGGMFPFRWTALIWTLAVCAAVVVMVPRAARLVRIVASFYAVASVGAFFEPTPLGANITRFGMYAAAPALLATVPWSRQLMLTASLAVIAWWQWSPAFDAIVRAGRDPSTSAAYYGPLLDFLHSTPEPAARVEVVPTRRHWEAAYVADEVPIARGWERQLDMRFNPVFYEHGLTADRFHQWLLDDGVSYVALADTEIDSAGEQERALIESGLDYLRPVMSSDHWRVWEVVDARGLVDGAAQVVSLGIDTVTLQVSGPGDLVVRIHASKLWATEPPLCVGATTDGWILIRDAQPGTLELRLDEAAVISPGDPRCATP